jgi:hypothetical protein
MHKRGSAYRAEAVKASMLEREAFKKTRIGVFLLQSIENFSKEELRDLIVTMNMDDFKRREKVDMILETFPVAQARVRAVLADEARAYGQ